MRGIGCGHWCRMRSGCTCTRCTGARTSAPTTGRCALMHTGGSSRAAVTHAATLTSPWHARTTAPRTGTTCAPAPERRPPACAGSPRALSHAHVRHRRGVPAPGLLLCALPFPAPTRGHHRAVRRHPCDDTVHSAPHGPAATTLTPAPEPAHPCHHTHLHSFST
jgi:hypothetical protein